jgi:hypothetical protein
VWTREQCGDAVQRHVTVAEQHPAIGQGGFNQSNVLSGGGASSIDLRNLGSNRSLLLINGASFQQQALEEVDAQADLHPSP